MSTQNEGAFPNWRLLLSLLTTEAAFFGVVYVLGLSYTACVLAAFGIWFAYHLDAQLSHIIERLGKLEGHAHVT